MVGRWYQAPQNAPIVTRLDTTLKRTRQAQTESQVPHEGTELTKKRLYQLRVSVPP